MECGGFAHHREKQGQETTCDCQKIKPRYYLGSCGLFLGDPFIRRDYICIYIKYGAFNLGISNKIMGTK